MARDRLQERLDALAEWLDTPPPSERLGDLRTDCQRGAALVVARVATIAERHHLIDIMPDLVAALVRFLDQPKRDPQCAAKAALTGAIHHLAEAGARADHEVLARAAGHQQWEPVWGSRVDTAAQVRANALLCLAEHGHPHLATLLASGLADHLPGVRAAAARAAAWRGDELASGLLRLRVAIGEDEPEVVGALAEGLLAIDAEQHLAVVCEWLHADDPASVAEAALALGTSRLADALPPLLEAYQHTLDAVTAHGLVTAIACHRSDEAVAWLLDRHAEADDPTPWVDALTPLIRDPRVAAAIGEVGEVGEVGD